MPDPAPSTVQAWIGLATASRLVFERVEADLKAAGLPPLAWYDALLEIERAGEDGIRPMELQDRLLLPQYGTSRLLDRLAAAGLTERLACAKDRRGFSVRISADGRDMRRKMWPVYARALGATMGAALDRAETDTLTALLSRVSDAARGR